MAAPAVMAIALRLRGSGNLRRKVTDTMRRSWFAAFSCGDPDIRQIFGTLRDGVARVACDAALQIEIALQALQIGAQIGRRLMPEIAVFFEQLRR